MLPFSREQFLAVFTGYNAAIWPAQIAAYALGALVLVLLFRPARAPGRLILATLALMWIWTGVGYHWVHFSRINPAAQYFAGLFVVQGLILAVSAARGDKVFTLPRDWIGWTGAALAAYAAILYPLIGLLAGHAYPAAPMFGVTPCPVTIFTIGILLLQSGPIRPWLLIIPAIWSFIGGSAAVLLGVPQDWGLLVSGVIVVAVLVARYRSPARPART